MTWAEFFDWLPTIIVFTLMGAVFIPHIERMTRGEDE